MVDTFKKKIGYVIGRKCTIAFKKNGFIRTNHIDFKDSFVLVEGVGDTFTINKDNINYIKYNKKQKIYSVGYDLGNLTTGIVNMIEGKFMTIDIWDVKINKYYTNVIPISQITGIKVLDEFDSEEQEVDLN